MAKSRFIDKKFEKSYRRVGDTKFLTKQKEQSIGSFPSKFDSTCCFCSLPIYQGDPIRMWATAQACHVDCLIEKMNA